MSNESSTKADRLAGAEAISAKAVAIGLEHELVIAECVWDIGEDFGHEHAHRLDIITATSTVRLYFPDQALTASANESRKKRTDDQLQRAIAQLLPRSPVPTYTFR